MSKNAAETHTRNQYTSGGFDQSVQVVNVSRLLATPARRWLLVVILGTINQELLHYI